MCNGVQLLHLQPAVPDVQRLHSLQPELNSLQVMTWSAAPVRDKQQLVERVAVLLPEVQLRLDGAIRQLDPRAQGFNARTGYQPAQLDALRGARDSELAGRQGQGPPGILGVLSEVLHVRCNDPTHARTLAALLSDVAGNRHMRSVVVHTRRADNHLSAAPPGGGPPVKVRMSNPRVWVIEFMSQGGDLVRADNNALGAAARSLGLPALAWPAGRCAAEFIKCDKILEPIRNIFFSDILLFANQAQGKAYKEEHARCVRYGRAPAILCLNGFYLAAAGISLSISSHIFPYLLISPHISTASTWRPQATTTTRARRCRCTTTRRA